MNNLGKKASDDDEVEQLLRAAQDDVLLKLSVDSHTARGSGAAAIDPDLDRRFLALKKPQKLSKHDDSVKNPPKEARKAADDDLLIRFAALKSSLPSNSSNFTKEEEAAAVAENRPAWAARAAAMAVDRLAASGPWGTREISAAGKQSPLTVGAAAPAVDRAAVYRPTEAAGPKIGGGRILDRLEENGVNEGSGANSNREEIGVTKVTVSDGFILKSQAIYQGEGT